MTQSATGGVPTRNVGTLGWQEGYSAENFSTMAWV